MGVLRDVGIEYGPEVVNYILGFAKERRTVTYGKVNEFLETIRGAGFANTDIGRFVGEIQYSLSQVSLEWPSINLVVVDRNGIVGVGAEGYIKRRYPGLKFRGPKYNAAIKREQTKVFDWHDWDPVIECLEGLRRLVNIGEIAIPDNGDAGNGRKGGYSDYGADQRTKIWAAIVARQGQSKFRNKLLSAYNAKCAITGCDCRQVLEACHIAPYLGTHTNELENGILLRADLHTLFDRGELGIDPETNSVVISSGLKDSVYLELMGKAVFMPADPVARPSKELLAKHLSLIGLKP
jgi:hypothetical protein